MNKPFITFEGKMSEEMEVDDDSETNLIQPFLETSPFVEKGRKLCIICFSNATKKNAKRAGLEKIINVQSYRLRVVEWTKYNHR